MINFREFIFCLLALQTVLGDNATLDSINELSVGNSKFTSAFYEQYRHKKGNLFFSPLSIQAALALVHAGADGNTATQIQQAVHLPETKEKSAKLFSQLKKSFQNDTEISINFVNGLYADKKFVIKEKYNEIVKSGFKAEIGQVDFGNSKEAAKTINDFVAKNTNNMIPMLFEPDAFTPSTLMVLLNAIYFKGQWLEKFPDYATHKKLFNLNEKETKEVDFMQITDSFKNKKLEDLDGHIIELPYKGESMSMVIIVPNKINGLEKIESKLSTANLEKIFEGLNYTGVRLSMPKFKLEETIELNEMLFKMGASDMFLAQKANLSKISDMNLVVSRALQKARISVDELGSEAAAATGIEISLESMVFYPNGVIDLTLDRPFLFYLIHKPTGLRLFMGRVASP